MKKRNYTALYTIIFAVMSAAFALTIYLNGKTQICNFDGAGQHIKALIFYSDWLKSLLHTMPSAIRSHSSAYSSPHSTCACSTSSRST